MISSNPALSGNTFSVRHGLVLSFSGLNTVAQNNRVYCVVAAFCVGVGIFWPARVAGFVWDSFDAYSVRRFWGDVRTQMCSF